MIRYIILQSHGDEHHDDDLTKFVCRVTSCIGNCSTLPEWSKTKCQCSLTCNNEKHEGKCAEQCCDNLDWYKEGQKEKEKQNSMSTSTFPPCFPFCNDGIPTPGGVGYPPCFPFCGHPWHPNDVTKRCCPNCNGNNLESSAESTASSKPTAATTKVSTSATTKGSTAATTKGSTAAPKPSPAPSGGSTAAPKPSGGSSAAPGGGSSAAPGGGGGGGSKQSDSGAKGCGDVAFHLILSLSLAYWLF